jgi:large subunit ribosomal protein L15
VNVGSLDIFDDGSVIDTRVIQAAGLANGNADGVKILALGEITKKLTIKVQAFSASAKAKIEGAGGTCEVTPLKKLKKSERVA